jgi:poly(A) polymerase Pap1
LKTLNQILQEIKRNKSYSEMTDEQLIYFAAYNLYLDIKIMSKETMTWEGFMRDMGYVKL